MSEEVDLIVNAIKSLKPEDNYIKDYVFPIASAFFTSLLGAAIAYFTLRIQENLQIEKDKMNVANKWILIADEIKQNLIGIKHNYHGNLTEEPFQRCLSFPAIIHSSLPIVEQYYDLSFILPSKNQPIEKWSQIPRIKTMILNYNSFLSILNKRNEIDRPIREKLFHASEGFEITAQRALDLIGAKDFIVFIDLTERLIRMVDDLLIEFHDFSENFPKYAKSLIDTSGLKGYGKLIQYSNDKNLLLEDILKRSPEARFDSVVHIFGESSEKIKKRHETGY